MSERKRRSRRDIELSLDLPFLNVKTRRKAYPSLSEKEIKRLAEIHSKQNITKQGE